MLAKVIFLMFSPIKFYQAIKTHSFFSNPHTKSSIVGLLGVQVKNPSNDGGISFVYETSV